EPVITVKECQTIALNWLRLSQPAANYRHCAARQKTHGKSSVIASQRGPVSSFFLARSPAGGASKGTRARGRVELRLDTLHQEDLGTKPYRSIDGDATTGLLILCDHADNTIPPGYGTLGLRTEDLHRHIAYDLGAAQVAEHLARALGAPARAYALSRLLSVREL